MTDYSNRPDPTIYIRLSAATRDAVFDWRQKRTSGAIAAIRTGVALVDSLIDANRDDRDR
jgi:hypothetical protein